MGQQAAKMIVAPPGVAKHKPVDAPAG